MRPTDKEIDKALAAAERQKQMRNRYLSDAERDTHTSADPVGDSFDNVEDFGERPSIHIHNLSNGTEQTAKGNVEGYDPVRDISNANSHLLRYLVFHEKPDLNVHGLQ